MNILPEPIQNLIDGFSRLPGIGPKTASRLTFYLLKAQGNLTEELADALRNLKSGTGVCKICFNITEAGRDVCEICGNESRDASLLCVVEDPLDVLAFERTGGFDGRYHVLQGVLSPIEGIGPEDLKIRELIERVKAGGVTEIIIATNPSIEGDATAMYLYKRLNPFGIRITRIARGIPMGGDLEYTDQSTLLRALAGRQKME
ncbi:MAG: recombination protein RecR [Anaerolineales bacterium]|nr:recombination protein RecR [Anaerolineales bacterium]HEY62052.1 recombination protein RecR [Anaerolineae bacterium]